MKLDTAKYEEKMKKTVVSFEETLSTIRAGQASSAVLNGISFEYYGAMTPLNTMADIKVTDSKTLVIVPYDKTTFKPIEKAINPSAIVEKAVRPFKASSGIIPKEKGLMISPATRYAVTLGSFKRRSTLVIISPSAIASAR